jgi:hypothetical protein
MALALQVALAPLSRRVPVTWLRWRWTRSRHADRTPGESIPSGEARDPQPTRITGASRTPYEEWKRPWPSGRCSCSCWGSTIQLPRRDHPGTGTAPRQRHRPGDRRPGRPQRPHGEMEVAHLSNLTKRRGGRARQQGRGLIGLGIEGEDGLETGAEAAADGVQVFSGRVAHPRSPPRRLARKVQAPFGGAFAPPDWLILEPAWVGYRTLSQTGDAAALARCEGAVVSLIGGRCGQPE